MAKGTTIQAERQYLPKQKANTPTPIPISVIKRLIKNTIVWWLTRLPLRFWNPASQMVVAVWPGFREV